MTPKEKFEETINTSIPESEYVGLSYDGRRIQLDGYFTYNQLELILKAYKEYLEEKG